MQITKPMLTLVQISEVEHEKARRYLEHLKKINRYHYRDERQARIERLEQRIKEYTDEHK